MDRIKYTRRGNFRIFRDRVLEGEAREEREAIQLANNVLIDNPGSKVSIDASDIEIDVEWDR